MKKFYIIIIVVIIVSLSFVFIFKKNIKEDVLTANTFKNDVFTKELFIELIEIDYWSGGEKIIIENKEDLKSIFNTFASLELSEFTPDSTKYGYGIIDFITKNSKISIGLSSDEIIIDGTYYHTNKDIVAIVRDIAMRNKE